MHAQFDIQRFLGKGSYGAVYKVRRKCDGATYALKETNVRHMSQVERNEAVNEVRLLAGVAHPHICEYYESFVDGNKLCIVMEYCPCGDLSRYVRRRQSQGRKAWAAKVRQWSQVSGAKSTEPRRQSRDRCRFTWQST